MALFTQQDEVLGQRHSVPPPVLCASMSLAFFTCDRLGLSSNTALSLDEEYEPGHGHIFMSEESGVMYRARETSEHINNPGSVVSYSLELD